MPVWAPGLALLAANDVLQAGKIPKSGQQCSVPLQHPATLILSGKIPKSRQECCEFWEAGGGSCVSSSGSCSRLVLGWIPLLGRENPRGFCLSGVPRVPPAPGPACHRQGGTGDARMGMGVVGSTSQNNPSIIPESFQYTPSIIPAPSQYHLRIIPVPSQNNSSIIPVSTQYHPRIIPAPSQNHSSIIPESV